MSGFNVQTTKTGKQIEIACIEARKIRNKSKGDLQVGMNASVKE